MLCNNQRRNSRKCNQSTAAAAEIKINKCVLPFDIQNELCVVSENLFHFDDKRIITFSRFTNLNVIFILKKRERLIICSLLFMKISKNGFNGNGNTTSQKERYLFWLRKNLALKV